jgi:hypothetical protein
MKFFLRGHKNMFFAADGATGGGGGADGGSEGGGNSGGADDDTGGGDDTKGDDKGNDDTKSEAEKLFEARLKKAVAEEKKKSAKALKELEKLRNEKLTAEERHKIEEETKAEELAEREREITEKENRYHALSAINAAGLSLDGVDGENLVELVMSDTSENIDSKVATLTSLLTKLVDKKVDEKFRGYGRDPRGGGKNNEGSKDEKSIAEKLGGKRAEMLKKSEDILKNYM